MILQGYRCDQCGIETRERQGWWFQVQAAHVTQQHADGWVGGDWGAQFRPNVQLCSRECAAAWFTNPETALPGMTRSPLPFKVDPPKPRVKQ